MIRHTLSAAVLTGIAFATRIELLPILAAVYVFASGSQWLSATRRTAALRRENADLLSTNTRPGLKLEESNHRRLRRSHWWLLVEWVATLWAQKVLEPLWARVDARDERASRGRHARHRWVTHQIHGTVAQRRPSAAAGQRAVHDGWQSTTAEQPVITDEQVHTWLAEGAQPHAVAD